MHIDARTIENNSLVEGDICIIGAGAAGISIALEWINTPYKIILLEGGGFDFDPRMQELYRGKTTGQRYYPLESARLHYFGGTTGHWAGFCSPLDDIDFEERDWVPHSGWPIKRTDLDSFYARAHKNLELGPYEYDADYYENMDKSLVSFPFDPEVVYNKMWHFSPPTRFGTKYRDAILQAPNVHLYTYANVCDMKANDSGSVVTELTVKNFAGRQHKVRAKYFISACCAIQNARLLLASNKQAPKGLGNDNDLVGRFFMEHLEIKSAELWLEKNDPLKLYMIDFGKTKYRAELAISAAKQRELKILNGTASLTPLEIAKQQPAFIDIWTADKAKREKGMANFDIKSKKGAHPYGVNSYQLFTRIEQAPNPESRIMLDTETDELGMPRAMLHWVLTPLEKRSIRKIAEVIGQQAGATAKGRVKLLPYLRDPEDNSWPEFTGGGWHHMGTTKMSADPKKGVVDANCMVHGISNLFMAGSSCYVTAGAPNPTLTVVALSLRLSDYLKKKINA
jgi:choline dehydrogenase-like flavoprotein